MMSEISDSEDPDDVYYGMSDSHGFETLEDKRERLTRLKKELELCDERICRCTTDFAVTALFKVSENKSNEIAKLEREIKEMEELNNNNNTNQDLFSDDMLDGFICATIPTIPKRTAIWERLGKILNTRIF